jgi:hypothetical protein
LKAYLKVNVTMHIEDPDAPALEVDEKDPEMKKLSAETERRIRVSAPRGFQVAGVMNCASEEEADRTANTIQEAFQKQLGMLSVKLTDLPLLIETPPAKEAKEAKEGEAHAPDHIAEEPCPHCHRHGRKVVDGDTLCNHCNRVVKLKPQPMA